MLKIGDTITIEANGEKYRSKILDIQKDAIYMNDPVHIKTNRTAFLGTDTQFVAEFVTETGQAYSFLSTVLTRIPGKINSVKITKPEQFIPLQRREFLRVNSSVDVAVHPLNKEFAPFTTVTVDLSAGGASIVVPKSKTRYFTEGQKILSWIVLPMQNGENHYLKLTGKVVRIFNLNEKSDAVSLQYLDKTKKQEQQLIKYCFEFQLLMKQKESIN